MGSRQSDWILPCFVSDHWPLQQTPHGSSISAMDFADSITSMR